MKHSRLILLSARLTGKSAVWLLLALAFSGCVGPQPAERTARDQLAQIGRLLPLSETSASLASLRPDSPPADFVRYAVLHHPGVFAAYYDWRATVESIAPTRALPDPQFTFEADIADTLMTFMPGLMFDFMTPGKRIAMAREATAASNVAYRVYVTAVLRTAAAARKAWIDLAYLDDALRLRAAALAALDQGVALADASYATGRGMGTLEEQVRIANDAGRVHAELAALADRRTATRTRFKSALGLAPADADPAWPQATLAATALPTADELWHRAQTANPELAQMRAMVEMAVAGIEVARQAGTPDFSLGLMADLKADPLMVRPTATVTLPVWREKLAALRAAAAARRDAAVARLSAEQLNVAAEVAQMLYMVNEADRMIAYIGHTALPSYERTIDTLAAGYTSGMTSPAMIPGTRLMALGMEFERAGALRERENAVTDLLLMIAAVAPDGAPLVADSSTTHP